MWLHNLNSGTDDYWLGTSTNTQYLQTRLGINTKFRIELKPEEGSVLVLERTTPPRLQIVMDLN